MGTRRPESELGVDDYRTVFHNISDGIIVHPPDSAEILEVNDRVVAMFGYDREELLEMTVSELTADDWEPPVSPTESIRQAREEGNVTFEWRNQREDGTTFWAEVNLSLVELQGRERVLSSIRDISERKARERRERAIFDQTYQFTGLMEPDGTLVEANRTALEFGDLDREDVVGKPLWESHWTKIDEETQRAVKAAVDRAAAGEFVRSEIEIQGSNTTEIIDFSVRPVTDDDGEVRLLVPEGRVITEQYERRQRLDVLDRVLRHNLRNQLTVIEGFAEKLANTVTDPELVRLAEEINEAGRSLEELGEKIRTFERRKRSETDTEPVALDRVLGELVSEIEREHPTTTVHLDVVPGLTVTTNETLLCLAVRNLVENALEHGAPPVSVEASRAETPGDAVRLAVSDDGDGLPDRELRPLIRGTEEALEHVSGLGLWIVKWSVDELDGTLTFDSDDDRTTVTITLPEAHERVEAGSETTGPA